jgi:hypothetical protein
MRSPSAPTLLVAVDIGVNILLIFLYVDFLGEFVDIILVLLIMVLLLFIIKANSVWNQHYLLQH